MTAIHPRKHQTFAQLDARRTAVAKTLWHIGRRRARPDLHPPINTIGLALQRGAAENA